MSGILNIRFWEFEFFAPHWLWLLFLVPFLLWFLWRSEVRKPGEWKYTGTVTTQKKYGSRFIHVIRKVLIVNAGVVLALLIVAMSKPYNWNDHIDNNHDYKNGIDIILTIDISGSMLEMDFQPNRIEAAKKVAKEFVDGRKGDRIGLVAYAGEAYTACPATTDYYVLKKQIEALDCYANIAGGTAIGVGLGTAVTRLRNDSIPSKVIILLTDGSNNMGETSPDEAADLAKAKNVRVYTIGVGAEAGGVMTINTPFGVIQQPVESDLDENTLQRIAVKTDGKYFRATSNSKLKEIYEEINKLETTEIEEQKFYNFDEKFRPFVWIAGLLLLVEILLRQTIFRGFI